MENSIKETLQFKIDGGVCIAEFWAFGHEAIYMGLLPRLFPNCVEFAANAVISIEDNTVYSIAEKAIWQKDKDGNFLY